MDFNFPRRLRRTAISFLLVYSAFQVSGCAGTGPRPSWLGQTDEDRGNRVLSKGREMVAWGEVLPGGCWDYINAVYNRAGYPESRRRKVYKTVKKGPYASPSLIKPGDWLYFVNYSYGGIEHSGIFVEWINRGARKARILSYAGESRREPGRYSAYDISSTYAITRPAP